MILAEIAKAETVEVVFMSWIAEGAEVRIVRRLDPHRAPAAHQPVKFLHAADHVVDVLDHMDRRQPVERTVGEGVRKAVQVRQDIGAARGIPVQPDRSGLFMNPAADVKNSQAASRRHDSRVSSAKSHWSRVTINGGHSRSVLSPAPRISRPRRKARSTTRSRRAGAFSLVCWSCTSSTPIISPRPRTSPTM